MTLTTADTELKIMGFEILSRHLGLVEAERFVALIQRERFDYTVWRETLFTELSGEEISRQAMALHRRKQAANAAHIE